MRRSSLIGFALAALGAGANSPALAECGIASNYSTGKITANGEKFRPQAVSAAHKTLPFGTKVAVVNPRTGRSIVVRINDRGPFVRGRIIDLSKGAARALGGGGLSPVCLKVLSRGRIKPRLRR
jgi:rare lipoprotein A